MDGALIEPIVILNAVFGERFLHAGNILRQSEINQRLPAFGLVRIYIPVSENRGELLCAHADIIAVVTILRQFDRIFSQKMLKITHLQRESKFFDLVARVVDVEFPQTSNPAYRALRLGNLPMRRRGHCPYALGRLG